MSQLPSVLALIASVVGTGTALAPAVFDGPGGKQVPAAETRLDPAAPGDLVTVHRDEDGMFYMPGRVNGVAVRFLLDSGANMVILPGGLAAAAGVPAGQRGARARTVAGGARFALSHARRIDAAGWSLANVPVAVAADNSAPPILGMNALNRMGRVTLLHDRVVFETASPKEARR